MKRTVVKLSILAVGLCLSTAVSACRAEENAGIPTSAGRAAHASHMLATDNLCPADAELIARIDASLARAGKYLIDAQSDDGGWYSQTYGLLRSGPTMTPYVLSSLLFMPQTGTRGEAAYARGTALLLDPVEKDGTLRFGPRELHYPVYTAAMASRVVAHPKPSSAAGRQGQLAYLKYLADRQLAEPLGWTPADADYGGWGYSISPPEKPDGVGIAGPFNRANLSATTFAVAAFRSAKTAPDDKVFKAALQFVFRCQNFGDDPRFDDGGFFFMPDDEAQNKAGAIGLDRRGVLRFRSYGTMTADGLRCLIRCGLPTDHPRVRAARRWLANRFSATDNPGDFPPDRSSLRNATYYYWVWSFAHAMIALRTERLERDEKPGLVLSDSMSAGRPAASPSVDWPRVLARRLIELQRADGTWANPLTAGMEDDPLVATPWASAALAICRAFLSGQLGSCRR